MPVDLHLYLGKREGTYSLNSKELAGSEASGASSLGRTPFPTLFVLSYGPVSAGFLVDERDSSNGFEPRQKGRPICGKEFGLRRRGYAPCRSAAGCIGCRRGGDAGVGCGNLPVTL